MLLIEDSVSILELKRLLHAIKDSRQNICVRFRIVGQMWYSDFTSVSNVADDEITLFDQKNERSIVISSFSYIMQFELDAPFQQYKPHFHYTIDWSIPQ